MSRDRGQRHCEADGGSGYCVARDFVCSSETQTYRMADDEVSKSRCKKAEPGGTWWSLLVQVNSAGELFWNRGIMVSMRLIEVASASDAAASTLAAEA